MIGFGGTLVCLMSRLMRFSLILVFDAVGVYNVKYILNDMTKSLLMVYAGVVMVEVSTLSICQGCQG